MEYRKERKVVVPSERKSKAFSGSEEAEDLPTAWYLAGVSRRGETIEVETAPLVSSITGGLKPCPKLGKPFLKFRDWPKFFYPKIGWKCDILWKFPKYGCLKHVKHLKLGCYFFKGHRDLQWRTK